jgi:hypothetical protein
VWLLIAVLVAVGTAPTPTAAAGKPYPIPFDPRPDAVTVANTHPSKQLEKVYLGDLSEPAIIVRYRTENYNDEQKLGHEVYNLLFVRYAKIDFDKRGEYVLFEAWGPPNFIGIIGYKLFVFVFSKDGKWEPRGDLRESTRSAIEADLNANEWH